MDVLRPVTLHTFKILFLFAMPLIVHTETFGPVNQVR